MRREVLPAIPGLRIVRQLGRGGMGAVYLAIDGAHGSVALKIIDTGETADPSARMRFEREIAAVSAVRHANVVELVDSGEIDGVPYALFERVRGRGLSRVGPQPWPVVVDVGRQLADAIDAVHGAGWLHRDIKRSNVMVGDHGLVTLIDFGLAKRWYQRDLAAWPCRPVDPNITHRGTVVGTPRYLAPEIRRGLAARPETDIYDLGLVLHELLGGTVDARGILRAPSVALPTTLSGVIRAALDVDPRRRPSASSIGALLGMLPSHHGSFRADEHDEAVTWPRDADLRTTRADLSASLRRSEPRSSSASPPAARAPPP
jgi:serine/threonine-protein kinase